MLDRALRGTLGGLGGACGPFTRAKHRSSEECAHVCPRCASSGSLHTMRGTQVHTTQCARVTRGWVAIRACGGRLRAEAHFAPIFWRGMQRARARRASATLAYQCHRRRQVSEEWHRGQQQGLLHTGAHHQEKLHIHLGSSCGSSARWMRVPARQVGDEGSRTCPRSFQRSHQRRGGAPASYREAFRGLEVKTALRRSARESSVAPSSARLDSDVHVVR